VVGASSASAKDGLSHAPPSTSASQASAHKVAYRALAIAGIDARTGKKTRPFVVYENLDTNLIRVAYYGRL